MRICRRDCDSLEPAKMGQGEPPGRKASKPPLHLWLVGILSLLWSMWGAYIALSAQFGAFPNLRPADQAYFDAQPLWFVIFADAGLIAGIAGAIALLVQHRSAVWLFMTELVILTASNLFEVAIGRSPLLDNRASVVGTLFLLAILALQAAYAARMRRRGHLE